jgi:hypothetical protein
MPNVIANTLETKAGVEHQTHKGVATLVQADRGERLETVLRPGRVRGSPCSSGPSSDVRWRERSVRPLAKDEIVSFAASRRLMRD